MFLEVSFSSVGRSSTAVGQSDTLRQAVCEACRRLVTATAAHPHSCGQVHRASQSFSLKSLIINQGCDRAWCFQRGQNRSRPVKIPTRGNGKGDAAHVTRSTRGDVTRVDCGEPQTRGFVSPKGGSGQAPSSRTHTHTHAQHARSRHAAARDPSDSKTRRCTLSPLPGYEVPHTCAPRNQNSPSRQISGPRAAALFFTGWPRYGRGRLRVTRDTACDFLPDGGNGRRQSLGDLGGCHRFGA